MPLTKETIIDKYEIVGEYRMIQCRYATIIKEDGIEISRAFNRHVIAPDDDISSEVAETKAIASAVHTPNVKAAYGQLKAARVAARAADIAAAAADK